MKYTASTTVLLMVLAFAAGIYTGYEACAASATHHVRSK
jgi:hypothetical protein